MRISGFVINGKREGMSIGFPTANVSLTNPQKNIPFKEGVYAGVAVINRKKQIHKAGIVISEDSNGRKVVEAYLIGFSGNLYGKRLTLFLDSYLRPFRRFKTKTLLKKQIEKDIARIKRLFRGARGHEHSIMKISR